jgi:hypothetical protein
VVNNVMTWQVEMLTHEQKVSVVQMQVQHTLLIYSQVLFGRQGITGRAPPPVRGTLIKHTAFEQPLNSIHALSLKPCAKHK